MVREKTRRRHPTMGGNHVERARQVTQLLTMAAEDLENGVLDGDRRKCIEEQIDRIYNIVMELPQRPDHRESVLRDWLISSCMSFGTSARDNGWMDAACYENFANVAAKLHGNQAPEQAERCELAKPQIAALIRAYAEYRGDADRPVDGALRALCKAMEYPIVSAASVSRNKTRRRRQ